MNATSLMMRPIGPRQRYLLAILVAVFAVLLRRVLTPVLGSENPYHTVWFVVVFCAWLFGAGPAIVAALCAAVGVWFWILYPMHSLTGHTPAQIFGMLGFLAFSGLIIALGESNRQGTEALSRLAAVVESSNDAIVSKNLDGTITSWNRGAEALFGYAQEEVIGKHITLIIPEERRSEEEMILAKIRNGERLEHFETIRIGKDGSPLDISLTISPVKDISGRIIGASKVARNITDRKRMEEVIRERELSTRLLSLQDKERRRMARELHDGVGQLIAAVGMVVSQLEGEKTKLSPDGARCLEEIADLTKQCSREIRTVSYLLHPPLLDEMGLESALQMYVEGFAERSKIAAKLETSGDVARLPAEFELCLFRIAQECLTNIHRHSESSRALVRLRQAANKIELEVSDSGKGMDSDAVARLRAGESVGVGVRGMRERIQSLGGDLTIESGSGGTKITAILPLDLPESDGRPRNRKLI